MIKKVSLRPLGKFFFGGESSFNEGGQNAGFERRATYLLRSNPFPQQTGVLGLVRNQLLLQNGLLKDNTARIDSADYAKAENLIGKHGFQTQHVGTYGVIKRISPIYLESSSSAMVPVSPLDDLLIDNKAMVFQSAGDENGPFLLRNYSEKAGLFQQVQKPGSGKNQPLYDVFRSQEQVGITKAARPWAGEVQDQDDEQGYFYQNFLCFNSKQDTARGFCFYVELDGTQKIQFQNTIVEFGGERSSFQMKVEDIAGTDFPQPQVEYLHTQIAANVKSKRLVCLSPAFVDMTALRTKSQLIVSQTLTFRFLQTKVKDTQDYQKLERNTSGNNGSPSFKQTTESKLFQLLDRGSVIYFDASDPAIEKDIKALFDYLSFQNIGYNQFLIL